MDRNKIDDKYKWNIDLIYDSMDKFNSDYDEVEKEIKDYSKYENIMNNSAKDFYETVAEYYKISRKLEKLAVYTSLLFDTDTSNNSNQALKSRVDNLYDEFNKISYFVTPNILKNDYEDIEKFYKEEPKLKDYEVMLKNEFRYKEHNLSDTEEKLISSLGKMMNRNYETYELLKDSDLRFGMIRDEDDNEVELTCSNYSIYIESMDRRVRKEAFDTLYKTYKQYINTFASCLVGNINENVTIAKIRNYDSVRNWCMYADEVDEVVYDNLIAAVNDGLETLFEYYDLKKELLNLDELHLYDIYTPIVRDYSKKYPFDEACNIVIDALSVLGEDYIKVLKRGLTDRWIDVYPTRSKRTGGYSGGGYDTNPYILLNYQDKYNDMSTLAHEAGHSMHSYYARSNNDYQYGNYAIFVAEVASTVNELLLSKYLLENSDDDKEKLFILDNLMTLFKSTIYRQTMFAEFEKDIYNEVENGGVLTADIMSDMYYKLNLKYFGDGVVVDKDVSYEWARIPHFYYNFYVYKYATGLSAACHIVNDILSGKEGAVENYIEFLKCGRTKNPLDSLKVAGVDLSKKETVMDAIEMFGDTIKQFKEIYKKNNK